MDDYEFDLDAELADEEAIMKEFDGNLVGEEIDEPEDINQENNLHQHQTKVNDLIKKAMIVDTHKIAPLYHLNVVETPDIIAKSELSRISPTFNHSDQQNYQNSSAVSLSPHTIPPCDTQYYRINSIDYLSVTPELRGRNIPCILSNGSRYFVRKFTSSQHQNIETNKQQLLSKSIHTLLKEVEEIQINIKLQESLTAESNKSKRNKVEESERSEVVQEKLWVEKYAPKAFSQLLSPEKINREVLKAIKQWDAYVFPAKTNTISPPNTSSTTISSNNNSSSVSKSYNNSNSSKKYKKDPSAIDDGNGNDSNDDDDKDSLKPQRIDPRPFHKVVLLCGPPGTGKTTLAHVLAKHCGYRPLEINSSDDRSVEFIRDTLSRAMQNNTLDADRRPNCVILDEIDGIDGRAPIDTLISIINTPLYRTNLQGKKKKASSSSLFPLTRPLICICNDPYVPALRELKKNALVFMLTSAPESRLLQRMRTICVSEGLSVGSTVLTSLCKVSGGDIRSCINTLQFASQKSQSLKNSAIENPASQEGALSEQNRLNRVLGTLLSSGLKDEQKDVFQIWREALCVKEAAAAALKKKSISNLRQELQLHKPSSSTGTTTSTKTATTISSTTTTTTISNKGPVTYASNIMQAMLDYGDNDIVLLGIQENFLRTNYSDPNFLKTQSASEWLSTADWLQSLARSNNSNSYALMHYVPIAVGAVHLLCASDTRMKVLWPTKDRDARYLQQQREGIIQSLVETSTGTNNSHLMPNKQVVVLEVLSPFFELLRPAARSLPWLSMTPAEQNNIMTVVRIMAQYGLQYILTPTSTSSAEILGGPQCQLQLEPNLNLLLQFKLPECTNNPSNTNNNKRMYNGQPAVNFESFQKNFKSVSMEVRSAIQSALSRYLITSKEDESASVTAPPSIASLPTVTHSYYSKLPVASPNAASIKASEIPTTSSSGATGAKGDITKGNAATTSTTVSAPENVPEVRGNYGRMDFFCKSTPSGVSTAKRTKIDNDNSNSITSTVNNTINKNSKMNASNKPKLFFKFNQGYSNAVRRPVTIKEFL